MNVLTFHITLLWVLAAFEFFLTLYILFRYVRRGSIYSLCGLLFGFAVISIFVGLQLLTSDDSLRILFEKLAYYGGCISFVSNLMLAIEYPIPSNVSSKWKTILAVAPLTFFLPYMLFVPHFLERVERNGAALFLFPGAAFWLFTIFVLAYSLVAAVLLLQKRKRVVGVQKTQVTLFTALFILSAVAAIVNAFLLPLMGIQSNVVFGAEAGGVLTFFIASVVLRKV